jgi:CDP-diacylglycerol--glycerol-3-phosphate 3-phosphatidyltransferase
MTKNIIGKTFGKFGSQWRDALAGAIINRGISPNILTVTGFMINIIGGVMLPLGIIVEHRVNWIHIVAGLVIILANIFDMLDGSVARLSGYESKFGAFFDSVLDRYSDMALLGGATIYFALRGDLPLVVVSALAFIGGVMTSYTRARAESLFTGKFNAGYMERPERIVVLAVSCLLSRLYMGMVFIAVFATLATFHRIWDVWRMDQNLTHPEHARKGYGSVNSPPIIRATRDFIFWTYPRETWQHDLLGIILLILTVIAPIR